jgi:2-(1,2-epoxy-1,2-dihydrophenyl)acetyl-CoA isomerase
MPLLEVDEDGAVLVLTLNRPESLNAFTVELHEELHAALKQARRPEIGAVVVTGAGRGFCVGQDLEEVTRQPTGAAERLERFYNPNLRALLALEKPVIAAVNGPAAGAGLALALACDIRVASSAATFVPAFGAIGLIPDSGASWTSVRLLGYARAFEWLTSNRKLGADEALALGLVSEVVEPDALLGRALERARSLAAAPGDGVALTKRLMRRAELGTFDEQLELERQLQGVATQHPGYLAAVEAFLAKRSGAAA